VVVGAALVAVVVLVPPLLARSFGSPSRTSSTIALNPKGEHAEFAKYFPDQPGAIKLVEEQSLWGWDRNDRYGWVNRDRRTADMEVTNGRRVGLQVPDPTVTVWLFGGSTAFGFGQRSDRTIASQLVRLASERGVPIKVENLGVSGWVNWQETTLFEDRLAAGERPDIAVFLDGANDTALGIEREKYGLLDPAGTYLQTMTDQQRTDLAAQAAARGYTGHDDLDVAARLAADQYRRGVLHARELGAAAGVKVVEYWQPQLYTIPIGAPLVRDALDQWKITPERHDAVGRMVHEVARLSGTDPVDLTHVFDHVDGPIFYDTSHSNERGARITAQAMLEDLWPTVRSVAATR
jgi:hypothetical protein